MLAVSAVGASTAMTGTFAAVTASSTSDGADVVSGQPVATDDVLVPAPPSTTSTTPASGTLANAATLVSAATTTTLPALPAQFVDQPAGATVLAGDSHRANAREIAALARSVDLERAPARSSLQTSAQTSAQPAGLGLPGDLDLAPGAGMRATALSAAMSKLGVPYVWGAAGPRAFDCSGLVLWAFNRVGISLPHSAAAQSSIGRPVSKSELRPGDLVFFYSPVSHVAMYIGNGKVVHASEPGQPVKISYLNRMPFHNARRL
ncbi:MAG: NlpC/P60 family protein [Actinomycetota bacterium]|nr:NlpC/P60 family protein [Actinomycetota bacterium]